MLVVTAFFTFTYSRQGERPVSLGNALDESVKVSVLQNLNARVPFSSIS